MTAERIKKLLAEGDIYRTIVPLDLISDEQMSDKKTDKTDGKTDGKVSDKIIRGGKDDR